MIATDYNSLVNDAKPYQGITGSVSDWVIIYLLAQWALGN
jgi:hypothetical protein